MNQEVGSFDLRALAPVAVIAFVIAAIAAFLVSSSQPGVYEAQASVSEANTERALGLSAAEAADTVRRMELHARVAESTPILERAIERLELDMSPVALDRRVEASVSGDGSAVVISVEGRDATLAAALANVIAEEVVAVADSGEGSVSLAATIDAELETRIDRLGALQRRVEFLAGLDDPNSRQRARLRRLTRSLDAAPGRYARLVPFSSASTIGGLTIIDPATKPTAPVRPLPFLDGLLAGLVGIIVVLPLAYLPNFLRATISTADDVREESGIRNVAEVPRVPGDLRRPSLSRRSVVLAAGSTAAETYRRVALGLRMSSPAERPVVLVAAPRRSDAKSATASNVALALAEAGRNVVLVDADLDQPRVHRMLGIDNGPGLAEWLAGEPGDHRSLLVASGQAGLQVLTAGDVRSHRGEHVGQAAMRQVLNELRASHDVVIDSPPLRDSAAAQILGTSADHLLLALSAGRSRRTELSGAMEALHGSRIDVMGAVLVHLPSRWAGALADLPHALGSGRRKRSATAAPSWPQPAPRGVGPTATLPQPMPQGTVAPGPPRGPRPARATPAMPPRGRPCHRARTPTAPAARGTAAPRGDAGAAGPLPRRPDDTAAGR